MQKYKKYLFFIFLCCIFILSVVCRLQVATFKAGSLQPLRAVCFCSRHKRREQIYFLLVGVPGSCWLVWLPACLETRVLVGVSWFVWLVSWLVWLPACLETRVPGWCVLVRAGWCVLVRAGWCALVGVVTCMP